MRQELKEGNKTVLSRFLAKEIDSNIKNGELVELTSSDLTTGDCLVGLRTYWDGFIGEYEYQISKVFYVEK
jgi:hypothetical protein